MKNKEKYIAIFMALTVFCLFTLFQHGIVQIYRNSMGMDIYTIVFGLIPFVNIHVPSQLEVIYNLRFVDIFSLDLLKKAYLLSVNPVSAFINVYLYYRFFLWLYQLISIIVANINKIRGKRKLKKL